MFKRLFPATLLIVLLGAAPAVAGSFFGPCNYGRDYYRQYPNRTYLGWCCCCRPPWTTPPAATPEPPRLKPLSAPASLPAPTPLPTTPPKPPSKPDSSAKQP